MQQGFWWGCAGRDAASHDEGAAAQLNIDVAILTLNSSHTVRKTLGSPPGAGLLPLLRGARGNAETVVGNEDYVSHT